MYLKNIFENKLKNYTNENTLKNKLEGIPKDVIVSESNMIEMDDTNPFAIGHDLFTNEEKNRLKKFFKSIKNGAFFLSLGKSNTIIRLIDFIGISITYIAKSARNLISYKLVQKVLKRKEEEDISNMRVILIEEGNFESDLKAPNSLKLTLYFGPLETDLVTNVNSLKNTIKSIVHQDQVHVALKFMTAGNHSRKHILDKFKDQNDFMLVEYSFGLLVAIELTRKLETKRFIGQLILITKAKVGVVDSDHVTILYVIDTKIVMVINDELF
ncbi:fatty acid synthase-like [Vespula maculifrons]|uniref:Fatty acid synthase-like n=1 Tax=Vespula maculifrons TaxID=7453 RepID=A0ABD2CKJ4_VESMC